jgi:hypothetical protein
MLPIFPLHAVLAVLKRNADQLQELKQQHIAQKQVGLFNSVACRLVMNDSTMFYVV